MRAQLSIRDYENLSAYLDGQLTPAEKARLEEQMRVNSDLRLAFDEMSRTRSLLRSAPRHRAPRNFTLTPAMVGAGQRKRGNFFNLFPVLSFTSALAAMALVFSLMFEMGPMPATRTAAPAPQAEMQAQVQTQEPTRTVAQPAADLAQEPVLKAAPANSEAANSQDQGSAVITWGFPSANKAPDGLGGGGLPVGGGLDGSRIMDQGGYGGGGPVGGMGGGAIDGYFVVPLESVADLEPEGSAAAAPPEQQFDDIPLLEGSGPILGVPEPEAGGQYLDTLPTPLPAVEDQPAAEEQPAAEGQPAADTSMQAPEEDVTASEQDRLFGLPQLQAIRILLGLLALITGAAAVIIWLKNR